MQNDGRMVTTGTLFRKGIFHFSDSLKQTSLYHCSCGKRKTNHFQYTGGLLQVFRADIVKTCINQAWEESQLSCINSPLLWVITYRFGSANQNKQLQRLQNISRSNVTHLRERRITLPKPAIFVPFVSHSLTH